MELHELPKSRYFTIEQLTDGVYAAIAEAGVGAWSNAGIIDLGDATLIFDTFLTTAAASDLRQAAEQLTQRPVKYVVNSHRHIDHVFGNQVFADATIISTAKTREELSGLVGIDALAQQKELLGYVEQIKEIAAQQKDPRVANAWALEAAEFAAFAAVFPDLQLVLPTVTFVERLQIHGAKRTVEVLSYGGGHSVSDAFLYLPAERVAFMGDLAFVDTIPSLHTQLPQEWIANLQQVQELDIETVVPGHGPVGNRRHFADVIRYLRHVTETVENARANGWSLEAVISTPVPEEYGEFGFANVYAVNLEKLYKLLQAHE